MNQAHEMHFSIISKTYFECQIWVYRKLTFEGLHIVIIQKFKFQKMCIKGHNGSNINEHIIWIVWFGKCAILAKVINFQLIN
jgi:hypothetical protein